MYYAFTFKEKGLLVEDGARIMPHHQPSRVLYILYVRWQRSGCRDKNKNNMMSTYHPPPRRLRRSPRFSDARNHEDEEKLVHDFESFCKSDLLSLELMQQWLDVFPSPDSIKRSSFLHHVCANDWLHDEATLDIVKCILDFIPDAASTTTEDFCQSNDDVRSARQYPKPKESYPLHVACDNGNCPNSVIRMLVGKYQSALAHGCCLSGRGQYDALIDYDTTVGYPLHYYLYRESNGVDSSIDIEIVKMFVALYPGALQLNDDVNQSTPLNFLLHTRISIICMM